MKPNELEKNGEKNHQQFNAFLLYNVTNAIKLIICGQTLMNEVGGGGGGGGGDNRA